MIYLMLGIVWTVYGVCGLFGLGFAPKQYRGQEWEKKYIRHIGISYIMIGVGWMMLYSMILRYDIPSSTSVGAGLGCALPGLIYCVYTDRKYKWKRKPDTDIINEIWREQHKHPKKLR